MTFDGGADCLILLQVQGITLFMGNMAFSSENKIIDVKNIDILHANSTARRHRRLLKINKEFKFGQHDGWSASEKKL